MKVMTGRLVVLFEALQTPSLGLFKALQGKGEFMLKWSLSLTLTLRQFHLLRRWGLRKNIKKSSLLKQSKQLPRHYWFRNESMCTKFRESIQGKSKACSEFN